MGKLNYAGHDIFWNQRFELVYKNLSPPNAQKFLEMPLRKKKAVIGRFVEKGLMI